MGPTRRDAGRSAPLCGPRSGLALEARGGRHVARWRGHLTPGPRVAAATQLSYAVVRWRSLRRSRACKVQSVCARQGAGCRLRTRGGGLISSVAREAHEEAEGPSYRRLLGSHTAQCINPHAYSCTSMYISHVHVPPISTHDLYMTCTLHVHTDNHAPDVQLYMDMARQGLSDTPGHSTTENPVYVLLR